MVEEPKVETVEEPKVETAEEPKAYVATGKRKTSVACVRLTEGKGSILINGVSPEEYFGACSLPLVVKQPLEAINCLSKYDVSASVKGGGISGQAGAIRHGIAKTLVMAQEDCRQQLKRLGFLTRDPRMKERKKYGQRGARARFQWTKR